MTKVIFTADDFGVNEGIDRGVIDAVNKGFINSVAAFANHYESLANVQRLVTLTQGKNPEIGCHLTLTSGKPITNGVKWLLTKRGFFRKYTNHRFPKNNLTPSQKVQVREELEAQIDVLSKNGIEVLHLSSHHNVLFWFKDYLDILVEISNHRNIPIRCPYVIPKTSDGLFLFSLRLRLADDLRFGQMKKIKSFARRIESYMAHLPEPPRMPFSTDARSYGPGLFPGADLKEISRQASKKRQIILEQLRRIPNTTETVEFLFHLIEDDYPALDYHKRKMKPKHSSYPGINSDYFDMRMAEYNLFKRLRLPDGIEPGSWKDL